MPPARPCRARVAPGPPAGDGERYADQEVSGKRSSRGRALSTNAPPYVRPPVVGGAAEGQTVKASIRHSPKSNRLKAAVPPVKAICLGGLLLLAVACVPKRAPVLIGTPDGHVRLCRSPESTLAVQIREHGTSDSHWRDVSDAVRTASAIFELLISSEVDDTRLRPGQIVSVYRDHPVSIRLLFADGTQAELSTWTAPDGRPFVTYDDNTGDLRSEDLRLENEALVSYLETLAGR